MMRQPGIYGIHTVTSTNGLRYAFGASRSASTRLLLLLQGIGWMGQFARFMSKARGGLSDVDIAALEPAEIPQGEQAAARAILDEVAGDRAQAAARAMSFAEQHPEPAQFARAARELIFAKGSDAHDYKYAAAIFEDYRLVSPRWRPQMLATAVYHLKGTDHPDLPLMERAREALKRV